MWAFLGALAVIAGAGAVVVGIDVIKHRRALPAWQAAARALGGQVQRSYGRMQLVGLVLFRGRPVVVRAVEEGSGRNAHTVTRVMVPRRHPDDVAAGTPPPPGGPEAWQAAWQAAVARAQAAELPRPEIGDAPWEQRVQRGLVSDQQRLLEMVTDAVETIEAGEAVVARWREAAAALGAKLPGAWLMQLEERGCAVRLVASVVSGEVVVRATGGPARSERDLLAVVMTGAGAPAGYDEMRRVESMAVREGLELWAVDEARARARLGEPVLAALARAAPTSVLAERGHVTVVVAGVDPDIERWRAAITLAAGLAAGGEAGVFR